MKIAYFTICSRNYLAYALTLRESLLAAAPDATFLIFLADAPIEGDAPCDKIIDLAALGLPDPDDMAFRYTVLEFNTAMKPFCFQYLFDRAGFDAAVYLDPDILVLRPLEHVTAALRDGADAVLTPHITAPLDDGRSPGDLDILRSGVFNLGFAAFADERKSRRFIDWWAKRCETECWADVQNGFFVDQKFAEFAPSFIARTTILHDPGYNVAYWNLGQRPVARDPGRGWLAGGAPLRFFHFSGVVPGDHSVFSKHQNRFRPEDLGDARSLLLEYLDRLEANGARRWSKASYAFERFSDGTLIPPEARRVYARQKERGEKLRPFEPFYDLLNAPSPEIDQTPSPITVFMHEIWRTRPDLQAIFPLACAAGRRAFSRWFLLYAAGQPWADGPLAPTALASGRGAAFRLAHAAYRSLPFPVRKWLRRASQPRLGLRRR